MRDRIDNYERFILMTVAGAAVIALLAWGILYLTFHVFEPAGKARHMTLRTTEEADWMEQEKLAATKESPHEEDVTEQLGGVSDPKLVLVNKANALPQGYDVSDLVEVPLDGTRTVYLKKEASDQLVAMFNAAKAAGYKLVCVSGYRDYQTQLSVHDEEVASEGEEQADMVSAKAGYSEHETGLVMDISCPENGYDLSTNFYNTPAGKWVDENCQNYGFIVRYPNGKESITGYTYEPWHLRYLGVETAKDVKEKWLTYEEYYAQYLENK